MSFVVYDIETTGLSKGYDQIVQFAALLTDHDLNIKEQFQTRCRLMPHVIPAPDALHATGMRIEQLTDPALPSHFDMIGEIQQKLDSWRPALFLGFNSLSFDEEFLRQAFYQCLHNAYLTNTRKNARADVLNLCRVAAAIRADSLKPAIDETGRPIFKLKQLAEANGIGVAQSHDALADAATTLSLCQLIKAKAPEVWSQFLRFSQKAAVEDFIVEEDAFLFSETIGNAHRVRALTRIGRHVEQSARHYCIDVTVDLADLRAMTDEELRQLCVGQNRMIVTIRTNAAPTLWTLFDSTPEHLAPLTEEEIRDRANLLREDRELIEKLRAAAQASEKIYPPSRNVEDQLYEGGFPPPADVALMMKFREASWEERLEIADQIQDKRYRRLAARLIYFERPDLLEPEFHTRARREHLNRILGPHDAEVPWRSIPLAQRQASSLIAGGLGGAALENQESYLRYLEARAGSADPCKL